MDINAQKYEKLKRVDTLEKEVMMQELKQKYIPKVKKLLHEKFKENLKSGLVVGLVDLPMCISFAVASGAIPESGLLSGIWGGVFGGLVGGSYYNVLGPAGALCGFLAQFSSKWGSDALPWLAMMSGLIALLVMVLKIGRFIDVFPACLNEGFTMGIAFSIFFGQMQNALGIQLEKLNGHAEESILNYIVRLMEHIDETNKQAFALFLLFLILLFLLTRYYPHIPWIILVNILGIFIGYLALYGNLKILIAQIGTKFDDMSFQIVILPKLPDDHPSMLYNPDFYVDCIPTAITVILECLISAKIADSITNTKFNIQRELKGLFITNLIVGFLGGIPVTASLPRTALNIKSGATHKYSSIISSSILFIMGLIFFQLLKVLPLCCIASQMCFISLRMVNIEEVMKIWKVDKKSFGLFMLVFLVSILTDPIVGIFAGLLVYQLMFSGNLLNPYSEVLIDENIANANGEIKAKGTLEEHFRDIPKKEGKYVIYRIVGVINFMNIDIHKERIFALAKSDDSTICLSLRYLNISDVHALEALKQLIDLIEANDLKKKIPQKFLEEFMTDKDTIEIPEIEETGGERLEEPNISKRKILLTGISQSKYNQFSNSDWFIHLQEKGQIYISDDIQQVNKV